MVTLVFSWPIEGDVLIAAESTLSVALMPATESSIECSVPSPSVENAKVADFWALDPRAL